MKRILITGGPTNEYIDEVMKITNMSTGSLSVALGHYFWKNGYEVCLILNNRVNAESVENLSNVTIRWIETTADMLDTVREESQNGQYDAVIHAAAVGDYTADFSFLMEDLAEELFARKDQATSAKDFLKIMENPQCKLNDDSKISSYQKNLTVKLGLTPKIIGNLRAWFPNALLIGCKLLENVSKEELYSVANKLCMKNEMDFILANDLADLRQGKTTRYLVDSKGYTETELKDAEDIFVWVHGKLEC